MTTTHKDIYDAEESHLAGLATLLLANAEAKARSILGDRFQHIALELSSPHRGSRVQCWIFTHERAYGGVSSFAECFDELEADLKKEALSA